MLEKVVCGLTLYVASARAVVDCPLDPIQVLRKRDSHRRAFAIIKTYAVGDELDLANVALPILIDQCAEDRVRQQRIHAAILREQQRGKDLVLCVVGFHQLDRPSATAGEERSVARQLPHSTRPQSVSLVAHRTLPVAASRHRA